MSSAPLPAGQTFTISVDGLPEGRTRTWIVGAIVGGLLVTLSGFFAVRTRPKISGKAGETVLTG